MTWFFVLYIVIAGKYEGIGNLIADLRTWLGDILVKIDTCMDGFEGSSKFKGDISMEIKKLNILVSDVLNQVLAIGDGKYATIISGNLRYSKTLTTYKTTTFGKITNTTTLNSLFKFLM